METEFRHLGSHNLRGGGFAARNWGLIVLLWIAVHAGASGSEGTKAGGGIGYVHDVDPSVPWSIHVFKLRRGHPGFELHTTLGHGDHFGMAGVSDQLKTLPRELGSPVGALNGDFYGDEEHYAGRPRDLQIVRGELVSAPAGNPVFWVDPEGTPHLTNLVSRIRLVWSDGTATPLGLNEERGPEEVVLYSPAAGPSTHATGGLDYLLVPVEGSSPLPLAAGGTYRCRVRSIRPAGDCPVVAGTLVLSVGPQPPGTFHPIAQGEVVVIATDTFPSLAGVQTAIGGGPTLVRNGKAQHWGGLQMRHPRSAVGFSQDTIYLVEVDGRQGRLSLGMSLPELATYMEKLGCESAMNLDGGGSATLWVFGNVINSPSEGRERPSANALVVVEKPRKARHE